MSKLEPSRAEEEGDTSEMTEFVAAFITLCS
jgi:hypothetical protein